MGLGQRVSSRTRHFYTLFDKPQSGWPSAAATAARRGFEGKD